MLGEEQFGVLGEAGAGGGEEELDILPLQIDGEIFSLLMRPLRQLSVHRGLVGGLGQRVEAVSLTDFWRGRFLHGSGILLLLFSNMAIFSW